MAENALARKRVVIQRHLLQRQELNAEQKERSKGLRQAEARIRRGSDSAIRVEQALTNRETQLDEQEARLSHKIQGNLVREQNIQAGEAKLASDRAMFEAANNAMTEGHHQYASRIRVEASQHPNVEEGRLRRAAAALVRSNNYQLKSLAYWTNAQLLNEVRRLRHLQSYKTSHTKCVNSWVGNYRSSNSIKNK